MRGGASPGGRFLLPPIMFHDKAGHRFDRFLFKNKALALLPAPCLFVLAYAAQEDFVRQEFAGECQ
jgi:hypothetical protein